MYVSQVFAGPVLIGFTYFLNLFKIRFITETDSQTEQTCGCQEGAGREGMDWGVGVGRCKLLALEWISNEVLLYSTGNSTQSLGIDHGGR